MSTTEERISTLYPEVKQSSEEDGMVTAQQGAEQGRADTLYPATADEQNGNPYCLEDSRENSLYGASERIELSADTDLSVIAGTFENADAEENLRSNLGYIGAVTGVDQQQLQSIVTIANEALITEDIPDAQQTMKVLHDEYGAVLMNKLIDARTLVSSVPEVRDWLDSTGLGDHPGIIRQIIKAAESPRGKARIAELARLQKGSKK